MIALQTNIVPAALGTIPVHLNVLKADTNHARNPRKSCPTSVPSATMIAPKSHIVTSDLGDIPVHLNAFKFTNQSRKRVRFDTRSAVHPIDCRFTDEEKSCSHYSMRELKGFSGEVKKLAPSSESFTSSGIAADPSFRGLEIRLCPVRAQNSKVVRKAVLKYQQQLTGDSRKTPEKKARSLAALSCKVNSWSSLVAQETARLDALRATEYDKESHLLPSLEPRDISPFPLPLKRKRVLGE